MPNYSVRVLRLALAHQRGRVALVSPEIAELADTTTEEDLEQALREAVAKAGPAAPAGAPPHPPHLRPPGQVFADWEERRKPFRSPQRHEVREPPHEPGRL